ncbi:MAG TPA: hypothetical protein VLZ83_04560 [Edaphocola sp.]|nr:hypothetical protein [Edaphocola sp.]
MIRLLIFITILLFSLPVKTYAQTYKFFGVLTLGDKSNQRFTYNLFFTEKEGKIQGFSITDIGGKHETKNKISGSYNPKTHAFSFKENEIVYTKSKLSQSIFCYINYSGSIKFKGKEASLTGKFTGNYNNQKPCAKGTLNLWGEDALRNILIKLDKKLENKSKKDNQTMPIPSLEHSFDSLHKQNISNNENLNIFIENTKTIKIFLWDNAAEDGDIVDLFLNDKIILKDFEVLNQKKELLLNLDKEINIIKIVALNQGTQGLNTVMMSVEGDDAIKFQTNLKTNESSTVTLVKKKQ